MSNETHANSFIVHMAVIQIVSVTNLRTTSTVLYNIGGTMYLAIRRENVLQL